MSDDMQARALLDRLTKGRDATLMKIHLFPDKTDEILGLLARALDAARAAERTETRRLIAQYSASVTQPASTHAYLLQKHLEACWAVRARGEEPGR